MTHPRIPATTVLRLLPDGELVTVDGLRPVVAALPLEPGHHVVVDIGGVDVVGPRGQEVLSSLRRLVALVRGTVEIRGRSARHVRRLSRAESPRHRSLTA